MKRLVCHGTARIRESNNELAPCKTLAPDFMLTLVTAPGEWPMLASKVAVWILNSWTMSCGGEKTELRSDMLGAPSTLTSLEPPRVPLTIMSVAAPVSIGLPA